MNMHIAIINHNIPLNTAVNVHISTNKYIFGPNFRLKMIVKMMQYLNVTKRPYHDAHQLQRIIIIKCWVSQLVQKPCDPGIHCI